MKDQEGFKEYEVHAVPLGEGEDLRVVIPARNREEALTAMASGGTHMPLWADEIRPKA